MTKDSKEKIFVKVMVACQANSAGEPTIRPVFVQCIKNDLDQGEHYYGAKKWADKQGYEAPFVAFDQYCYIGNELMDFFFWDTADIVDLDGDVISIPNKTSKG